MKKNIKHVRVELEDGTAIEHSGGRLNIARNYRTAPLSSKIIQEWYEYVVTWHIPVEIVDSEPTVEKINSDRETIRGKAWCSQHQCEPHDCFKLHNSNAFAKALNDEMKTAEQDAERWRKSFAKPFPVEKSSLIEFNFDDINQGYGNGQH